MATTVNTDAFWSAVKRKNIPEVLGMVFDAMGETEASELAKNTTRMTDLAIRKMRDALPTVEELEGEMSDDMGVEESDKAIDPEELDTDEYAEAMVTETEENEIKSIIKEGKKLIKKGKEKKAKKLFKKHGLGGSEIEKLFRKGK